MDIRKIILKNSTNSGDYIPDYHYDALEKDIKGLIRQALELACDKIEKKKPLECGYIGYKMGLNDSKQSIMSIMDEL